MRLNLIDRIESLESGQSITAIKGLSSAEPYLKDHFPLFPVMPGVLMLEALYQASVWLLLASHDFSHSMVLLKEARNVRYADFVDPGEALEIRSEITKQDGTSVSVKAQGRIGERVAVSGRLVLEPFNLADKYPIDGPTDGYIKRIMRKKLQLLLPANQPRVSLG